MKTSRFLTDYKPSETWRQRRAREAAERRRVVEQARRRRPFRMTLKDIEALPF